MAIKINNTTVIDDTRNLVNLGSAITVAQGGTGATTASAALTNLGAYPATNPSGYTTNTGTVTSVSGTGTVAGLSLSGTVTSSGNITLGGTLSTPVSTISDSTTVGQNLVKLTNPSAVTFLRVNADNTVSALDASTFRTAIGFSPTYLGSTPPGSPVEGQLWWDSISGTLKIYYNDGSSTQWVDAVSVVSGTSVPYPAAGIPVSTGSAWTTSKTAPSGDIVGTSDTQTLTNKTYGNGNAGALTFLWSTSAATKDGIAIYGRNGGTATYRVTITNSALSANRTQTLPDLNGEFILDIGAQQLRSKTLRAPNFIEDVDGDETRDGIIVTGRSGGTSSRRVTIIPTTLTANRTATLPDAAGTFVLDTATQTLTNKTLTTPIATGILETRVAMGANDVNLASGNYFTKTLSAGSVSLTVSNVPSTGTVASFILDLTNGGLATITWFTGIKWAGGSAPTLTSSGRDVLGFFTHDGGTTWNGLLLGKDLK